MVLCPVQHQAQRGGVLALRQAAAAELQPDPAAAAVQLLQTPYMSLATCEQVYQHNRQHLTAARVKQL